MTIQECCGSIMSNDPNVKESSQPYMTRNCYETDEWSMTECSRQCCGSSDATCFPTYQGGYCAKDGTYYKYQKRPGSSQKEKFRMSRNAFLSETPYQRQPEMEADWSTTNWYNEARYWDMRQKVIRDLANESMDLRILREPGRQPRPLSGEIIPTFKVSQELLVGIIFLVIGLFITGVYSINMFLR